MPAFVTVAYPRPSGEFKFDLDYYLKSHMPLVAKTWEPKGLKAWTVTQHSEGPYVIQAILEWTSIEAFDAAAQTNGGPEVFADVLNFTDITPIPIKGEVKGSWSS